MSIGLGIFLGLVFLGLVVLYTKNRDSISVKKIFKWIGIVVGTIVMLFVLIYLGFYLKDMYDTRPQVISEFRNITIGDSLSDTKFKVGNLILNKESTKNQTDLVNSDDGIYNVENSKLSLKIVDNKVKSIFYECGDQYDHTSVNGIECNNFGEKILEKFGSNVEISCLSKPIDGFDKDLIRRYAVFKYNVRYFLSQNQVTGFMIGKRNDKVKDDTWKECK